MSTIRDIRGKVCKVQIEIFLCVKVTVLKNPKRIAWVGGSWEWHIVKRSNTFRGDSNVTRGQARIIFDFFGWEVLKFKWLWAFMGASFRKAVLTSSLPTRRVKANPRRYEINVLCNVMGEMISVIKLRIKIKPVGLRMNS